MLLTCTKCFHTLSLTVTKDQGYWPPVSKKKGNVRMATKETANVGRAVAARVGTNIREVRTKLGLTQAQLASPEFSISYISAIERGKIRPSLKALSILAKRL